MTNRKINRPALSAQVMARRHIVEGDLRVVLHDASSDKFVVIGEREWSVLQCADGTRDVLGILAAARQRGRHIRREHLEDFLEQLQTSGFLEDDLTSTDGNAPGHSQAAEPSAIAEEALEGLRAMVAEHPLEPLPGYRFSCDGGGTCCKQFQTILFSAREALQAELLCPELPHGLAQDELTFTPERGVGFEPWSHSHGVRAVTLTDGRCAFLESDDQCQIQQIGGPDVKPAGCSLFPALFTDDGESIRVSVAPECSCVFRSAKGSNGEPLVSPEMTLGKDLPRAAYVRCLPDRIVVIPTKTVSRARYVLWSREVFNWLRDARHTRKLDAAAMLWALARHTEARGLVDPTGVEPAELDATDLVPWLERLEDTSRRCANNRAQWSTTADLALDVMQSITAACQRMLQGTNPLPRTSNHSAEDEHFLCLTLVHGHQLVDDRPLVTALRDQAVRMIVARSIAEATSERRRGPRDELIWGHPLALTEAAFRGQGLEKYCEAF